MNKVADAHVLAGSPLLVLGPGDDETDLKDEVMGDLQSIIADVDHSSRGVCVQVRGCLHVVHSFLCPRLSLTRCVPSHRLSGLHTGISGGSLAVPS